MRGSNFHCFVNIIFTVLITCSRTIESHPSKSFYGRVTLVLNLLSNTDIFYLFILFILFIFFSVVKMNSKQFPQNLTSTETRLYILECVQSRAYIISHAVVIILTFLSTLFGNILILISIVRFSPAVRGMNLMIGMCLVKKKKHFVF